MSSGERKRIGGQHSCYGCPHPKHVKIQPHVPKKKEKRVTTEHENDQQSSNIEQVCDLIAGSKSIVFIVGAGISVNSGIPDFRSPTTGLYDIISRTPELNMLPEPQCLFDQEYFLDDPKPFYSFAKQLVHTKDLIPTKTHEFLAFIEKAKKLRRIYTQNIDNLEQTAGICADSVVQCHGSIGSITCTICNRKFPLEAITEHMQKGNVPICGEVGVSFDGDLLEPPQKQHSKSTSTRRRSTRKSTVTSSSNMIDPRLCPGILKPDIVFFGQTISSTVRNTLNKDFAVADLVIVMGTSLEIRPIAYLLSCFNPDAPQVLINKVPVKVDEAVSEGFDIALMGDCDDLCVHIQRSLLSSGQVKIERQSSVKVETST